MFRIIFVSIEVGLKERLLFELRLGIEVMNALATVDEIYVF
jgi:hypothetical protein